MNKKILSAVLALVMLVSMMSVMAFADEGSCDRSNGVYYDNGSYHAFYCNDPDCGFFTAEDHTFANGVCIYCGNKNCKHEHQAWLIGDGACVLMCFDCKTPLKNESHKFKDGKCEKCGVDECAHDGASWVEAPFEDGHFMYCDDCGKSLSPLEKHVFTDGVCEKCGAKKVTHVHYISGMNGQICLFCGAEIQCSHKAGDLVEWGSESHCRKCVNCGSIIVEDHTFVNGTCTVCGTKLKGECKHENQQWVNNDMDGIHVLLCVDCFELMSEPEQHEFKDGVCEKCGAEKSEPTNPSEEPTNPSEEPTNPSEEPTNPSEEPTNPSEEPTNPSEEPTNPSEEPTNPSEETTKPDAVNGVPQTGDTNNMAQWIGIVVLGCAGMAAAYVCGKKRI